MFSVPGAWENWSACPERKETANDNSLCGLQTTNKLARIWSKVDFNRLNSLANYGVTAKI